MTSPPVVRIRIATRDDKDFVLEAAHRLGEVPLPPWRTPQDVVGAEVRLLLGVFADAGGFANLLIAETAAAERIAFLYLEERTDYFTQVLHGHISLLAVMPQAEGKGVAAALLHAAEELAETRRLPYLTLNVFGLNARARALYERSGYLVDTVRYLKLLGPS